MVEIFSQVKNHVKTNQARFAIADFIYQESLADMCNNPENSLDFDQEDTACSKEEFLLCSPQLKKYRSEYPYQDLISDRLITKKNKTSQKKIKNTKLTTKRDTKTSKLINLIREIRTFYLEKL